MKSLFLIILLCFSFGFGQEKSHGDCDLFKNILSHGDVIQYLHPESKSRSKLYLIKNDFCNFTGNVSGIGVVTVDDNAKVENFIEITSVKEVDENLVVTLDYSIEGALFVAQCDKEGNVINIEIIEK